MLDDRTNGSDPFGPSPSETEVSAVEALGSYFRGIGHHWRLFAAIVLSCLFGAALWIGYRASSYSSTAEVLVTPISAFNDSLVGLPLIRSSDPEPQRAVRTGAAVLDSAAAARTAARFLGTTPGAVEAAITVGAQPDSGIIDVTAVADTSDSSARYANAYASAALARVDARLIPRARVELVETRDLLAAQDLGGATTDELSARLSNLGVIVRGGDPTLSLVRPAEAGLAVGLPPAVIVVLALVAGLALASVTLIVIELVVPRPLREDAELARVYPLPVLARAPGYDAWDDPKKPFRDAPSGMREGFRALRGQLEMRTGKRESPRPRAGSVVLLTSPEYQEDRFRCALNLGRAFVSAGQSATVIEMDVRNPRIAPSLRLDPTEDLGSLLIGGSPISEIGQSLDGDADLRVVPAPPAVDLPGIEEISARSVELIEAARRLTDWVLVDAGAVSQSADVAVVASAADEVVIVVELGVTTPAALAATHELFDQIRRSPDGYLVLAERGGSQQQPWRERTVRQRVEA